VVIPFPTSRSIRGSRCASSRSGGLERGIEWLGNVRHPFATLANGPPEGRRALPEDASAEVSFDVMTCQRQSRRCSEDRSFSN